MSQQPPFAFPTRVRGSHPPAHPVAPAPCNTQPDPMQALITGLTSAINSSLQSHQLACDVQAIGINMIGKSYDDAVRSFQSTVQIGAATLQIHVPRSFRAFMPQQQDACRQSC